MESTTWVLVNGTPSTTLVGGRCPRASLYSQEQAEFDPTRLLSSAEATSAAPCSPTPPPTSAQVIGCTSPGRWAGPDAGVLADPSTVLTLHSVSHSEYEVRSVD